IAATLAPLLVTVWISVTLLQRSLSLSPTRELDEISKSLEQTGREVYQSARAALKLEAASGRPPDRIYLSTKENDALVHDSFVLSGDGGNRLNYLVRHGDKIWQYSASLHGVQMNRLAAQYTEARGVVERAQTRNLRRGFTYTMISLATAIWI